MRFRKISELPNELLCKIAYLTKDNRTIRAMSCASKSLHQQLGSLGFGFFDVLFSGGRKTTSGLLTAILIFSVENQGGCTCRLESRGERSQAGGKRLMELRQVSRSFRDALTVQRSKCGGTVLGTEISYRHFLQHFRGSGKFAPWMVSESRHQDRYCGNVLYHANCYSSAIRVFKRNQ